MKRMIGIAACVAVLALAVTSWGAQAARGGKPPVAPMQVYKTPTCGCCSKWVEHVKAAGLAAEAHDMADVSPVKARAGVPADLHSCHTALVQGYVIEGHVPADVIKKLLTDKPAVAGIAVPGMPIGSPGMEQGDRKDPYEIIAFTKDGTRSVYATRP
jgi:hypothetical protein